MNKINSTTFKGIEYIRLSALPSEQGKLLEQTLDERTLIKILKNDIVLEDCVLYKAYLKWYESSTSEVTSPISTKQEPILKRQVTIA